MGRVALVIGSVGAMVAAVMIVNNLFFSGLLTRWGSAPPVTALGLAGQALSCLLLAAGIVGIRFATSGGARRGASLVFVSAFAPVLSVLSYLFVLPYVVMLPGEEIDYPDALYYLLGLASAVALLASSALLFSDRRVA